MGTEKYLVGGIIFVTLVLVIWSSLNDYGSESFSCTDSFGKEYNELRIEKNIPTIEDDWVMQECDTGYISWSNRGNRVNTIKPMHLGKIISIRNDRVVSEEDDFHYEGAGDMAYRLVGKIFHDNDDSVSYRFIKYFKDAYPPTTSFYVDKNFADSIFQEWGFPEYYK